MADIDQCLQPLRKAYNKLMNTDASTLNQDQKIQLAMAINKTSLLIRKLETAQIEGLSNAFKTKLPELQQASDKLARDLDGLNDSIAVIGVVSNFLATSVNLLKLLD